MPEEQNDLVPLSSAQQKYETFLAKMTEIGDNDIVCRTNCKFCQHPAREQAEQKWERSNGSYITVERFFEEYRKENPDSPLMSYTNIRGHIDHHYKQQIKKLRMREYANNLNVVLKEKVDQMELLDALAAALQMKFWDIASDAELDTTKQSEAQGKLAKIIVDVLKFKAELRGELKPVNIFAEKVLNMFGTRLSTETNNEFKAKLLEMVNDLETEAASIG